MIRWLRSRWGELQALRKLERQKLYEIDLVSLQNSGITALFLDVDNAIAHLNQNRPTKPARRFVRKAKRMGFEIILVSNVVVRQRAGRVQKMARKLGIGCVCAHWPDIKPHRSPYQKALELANVSPHHAAMIGDQLFTDMLGAIRTGIVAIWVECIGNDHPTTWGKRWLEGIVTAHQKHGGPER